MKTTVKTSLYAAVFAAGLSLPATGGDLVDGANASRESNYRTTLRQAKQGNVGSQLSLAFMYDNGIGVPEDNAEAAKWYRPPAERGDSTAQNNLGWLYERGEGVPENHHEAVKWYRRAAEWGNAYAQYNLGRMYSIGKGVPQHDVLAYFWFNIAAASPNYGFTREDAVKSRDSLAQKMERMEITEAQRLSRKFKSIREIAPGGVYTKAQIAEQDRLLEKREAEKEW